jgi:predicted nucleotide-binding protein (sugar kinase/HSP70/actin superfamily)
MQQFRITRSFTYHHQNDGQNYNINVSNKNLAEFLKEEQQKIKITFTKKLEVDEISELLLSIQSLANRSLDNLIEDLPATNCDYFRPREAAYCTSKRIASRE